MAKLKLQPATRDTAEGTRVILIDDDGVPHLTRTRSIVWPLGHGALVVKVEGTTGGYLLERVFVLPEQAS